MQMYWEQVLACLTKATAGHARVQASQTRAMGSPSATPHPGIMLAVRSGGGRRQRRSPCVYAPVRSPPSMLLANVSQPLPVVMSATAAMRSWLIASVITLSCL